MGAAARGTLVTALSPQLTKFDERVLAAIPEGKGARTRKIVDEVHDHYERHTWQSWSIPTREDIVGVLRGLEHLGLARHANGWWRR